MLMFCCRLSLCLVSCVVGFSSWSCLALFDQCQVIADRLLHGMIEMTQHPLEQEKLLYLIRHMGYVEPPPQNKPDFLCQYEYFFQQNKDVPADPPLQQNTNHIEASISSYTDSKPSLSKKRKLLDSFTFSSMGCESSRSETKMLNQILLQPELVPSQPLQSPTPPPPLRLKIHLKKKDESSSSSPTISAVHKDKQNTRVGLDVSTIQKLKMLMHPKKQQQQQQQQLLPTSSTTTTKSCTKLYEDPLPTNTPRALTTAQVQSILAIEDTEISNTTVDVGSWVRRSTRQPSRSAMTSLPVQTLVEKLKMNDPDCIVLKMKKYLPDPNTPSVILDTVLDALEQNTNCQALYIQNFNEGIRDEQFLHLLRILQKPTCSIWCINVGEIYKVKTRTWATFTEGLAWTKITHMYASEHIISGAMKEMMREIIRENRDKHTMHMDPDNIDVIVQCTHNWWNPMNAAVLRPYLKDKGYEHLLMDKDSQGQKGTETDHSKI